MWLRRSLFLGPGPSRPRLKHSSGTQYRRRGVNDTPAALSFFSSSSTSFSFSPFRSVPFLSFFLSITLSLSLSHTPSLFPVLLPANPVTLALSRPFFLLLLTRVGVSPRPSQRPNRWQRARAIVSRDPFFN